MKKKKPLAHSAHYSGQEQSYEEHISSMRNLEKKYLAHLRRYLDPSLYHRLDTEVDRAGLAHDLGKLDERNQDALYDQNHRGPLPVPHQNAGAYYLYQSGDNVAAALVLGHHSPGLPDLTKEIRAKAPFIRPDGSGVQNYEEILDELNYNLSKYLKQHRELFWKEESQIDPRTFDLPAMGMRVGESLVANADRDSTGGYRNEPAKPRWQERLKQLDRKMQELELAAQSEATSEQMKARNTLRHEVYECCRNREPGDSIGLLEGCVGTGKTTAGIAATLREAIQGGLRRILIVEPHTSILTQVEAQLKELLLLDDEQQDPQRVIAVHHHRAEYTNRQMQQIANRWEAPIVLTTAVQLFETLASCHPTRLGKLHQLPGSVVFFDEFHASLPPQDLPIAWQWLTELSGEWGCKVILSSGTPVRFWENRHFREAYHGGRPEEHPIIAPEPLLPQKLQFALEDQERSRVRLCVSQDQFERCQFSGLSDLLDFALQQPGPRVIMMDTRYAAALTALEIQERGEAVYHLSNAFCPENNEITLKEVQMLTKEAQEDPDKRDWTLVTTPYAAMGLNLSFCTGLIRLTSLLLFLQMLGRISRSCEYEQAAAWCFELHDSRMLPLPDFEASREVFRDMIAHGMIQNKSPAELATIAMESEFKLKSCKSEMKQLLNYERNKDFATLADTFRVIEDKDNFLAVVQPAILDRLQKGIACTKSEIQRSSVSLRRHELEMLELEEISGYRGLYVLAQKKYDPKLLGYFKCVLQQKKNDESR